MISLNNGTEKKTFGRDVGKLVSGTVVAQIVALCLTPIITRIFSPEIYGIASVFTSIVSIIVVISCLRYELAIMLPKDDCDAGAVFLLCLIILVCISLICIPIIIIFGDFIANLLGNPAVEDYLFLVPIAVFIDGLYMALRYWNTRCRRFGTQAVTQALQSITGNGLKLGLGVCGFVIPGSLIMGGIVGNGLGMIILMFQALKNDFQIICNSISFENVKNQMRIFKKFPLIDTWNSLINTISWQLPVLMLTGFFSSAIAGLYTLGFQILQLPVSIIGSSIGQVFFQRASIAKHTGNLPNIVEDICSLLFLISICPFLLLALVGGDLFSIVFGDVWSDAGIFTQILALWILLMFISSPMSTIISVLEIQGFGLMTSIANLILRFISLMIGGLLGDVYIAIILFAISGFIVYSYCIYAFVKKSGGSFIHVWKNIRKILLIWIFVLMIIILLYLLQIPSVIICIFAIIVGILYYVILARKVSLVKQYLSK